MVVKVFIRVLHMSGKEIYKLFLFARDALSFAVMFWKILLNLCLLFAAFHQ